MSKRQQARKATQRRHHAAQVSTPVVIVPRKPWWRIW